MNELLQFISSSQFWFYLLISLIPIVGWIYFFQKIHRERRSYVVISFLAGMVSIIPIKLYEKYWDTALFYFEHTNVFRYLEDLLSIPDFSRFMSYVTVNGIVAMALFFFTACLMFFLEVFTRDNTIILFRKKFQKILDAPFLFVSLGILFGIVAYAFSFFFGEASWSSRGVVDKFSFFLVVGMLEEFIKYLVLRFSDEEKVRSVDDALSFSILVALGFAFVENIMYFHSFVATAGTSFSALSLFFLLRSTISVLAHVSFSGILGYFYGVARFSESIAQQDVFRTQHPFLIKLHQVLHLKKSVLFYEEKMIEGMLLAMLAHMVFNLLLNFDKIIFVVPFLFVLFIWVLNLFHRKQFYGSDKDFLEKI